jgi:hypothetical protein
MTTTDERRADGIQRVPVEALVEVCGVGGKLTPFEAESADVSGRGIRLRTAYLPEPGAAVVCRFENAGREVIAEGVVAWCHEETRGGEFGVRFTALDARSAVILREFCGIAEDGSVAPPPVTDYGGDARQRVVPGAKVKLHIEGLGSPMRARVDEGEGTHLSVGSSLEFLRIGRKLELESVEDGSRREARIDGLDVMIDPSTGVPRLLVLLKTDGDQDTPQPSVVDATQRTSRGKDAARGAGKKAPEHLRTGAESGQPASAADDLTEEQVDAMVGRVRRIAGATRRKANEVRSRIRERLGPSLRSAFQAVRHLSRRSPEPSRRRTTAAPTASHASIGRKLRPQNRASQPECDSAAVTSLLASPRLRRTAGAVIAAGLFATVVAVSVRGQEPKVSAGAAIEPAKTDRSPLGEPAPGQPAATTAAMSQIPPAMSPAAPPGLVAQVPLFGPTVMATLERAPVAASTTESPATVAAREQALARSAQVGTAGGVDRQKLSEEPGAESAAASEEPTAKPEDVAPFGHGKMKDPILYRLRLDGPGEALKGTSSSGGFTVVIPGRKLLESPKGFVKRDERFQKITASSSSDGARITWQFKGDAPPFRVRLRKSAVEILISEAGKSNRTARNASTENSTQAR